MSRPKKASRFRIYDGQNSTKMILRCSDSVGAHCGSAFQLLQGARLFVSDLYFNGVIRSVGAVIKRAPSLEKTYVVITENLVCMPTPSLKKMIEAALK
jgi:hypothetical protein